MTEERKFEILFAATILAARRLIDMDLDKPNMAKGSEMWNYLVAANTVPKVVPVVTPARSWCVTPSESKYSTAMPFAV